jgi:tRNA(Met) cytidine acetyltransferase
MSDSGFTADAANRRLVLVGGGQARSEAWVVGRLTATDLGGCLWVSENAPKGIHPTPARKVNQVLGAEYRLLVFNAHQGFHPDAFAAAVGTLIGGGDCVVLAPALDAWPAFADPDKSRFACYPRSLRDMRGLFIERLVRLWGSDAAVFPVNPGDSVLALRVADPPASEFRLTAEQRGAVAAIERVAQGHARRPLVLTADRGRGKSTVLGIAAWVGAGDGGRAGSRGRCHPVSERSGNARARWSCCRGYPGRRRKALFPTAV